MSQRALEWELKEQTGVERVMRWRDFVDLIQLASEIKGRKTIQIEAYEGDKMRKSRMIMLLIF